MDVSAAFVADHQAPETVKPCEIPLGDPSVAAEPLAGLGTPASDTRCDPTSSEALYVCARAIPEVRVDLARSSPRTSATATHRNDAINHHEERDNVGHVRRREHRWREGQTVPIHDHMVLGALLPAICRVLAGLRAPLFAGACAESTDARDQSIAPARWSRSSKRWWIRCQTPARCQSRRRFQQVMPLHPISCGRYSQGIPVRRTNTIPEKAARSGARGRPRRDRCEGGSGSSEATIAQSSSSTSVRGIHSRIAPPAGRASKRYCKRNNLGSLTNFVIFTFCTSWVLVPSFRVREAVQGLHTYLDHFIG